MSIIFTIIMILESNDTVDLDLEQLDDSHI